MDLIVKTVNVQSSELALTAEADQLASVHRKESAGFGCFLFVFPNIEEQTQFSKVLC